MTAPGSAIGAVGAGLRRYGKVLASLAIVAGTLLFLSLHKDFHLHELLVAASHFPLWAVAVSLGLAVLQNVLQGARLWFVLPGKTRLPFFEVFRSYTIGQIINSYVPARAGDVAKIALIRKAAEQAHARPSAAGEETATSASLAGSVLIADKAIDLVSLVVLILVMAPGWLSEVHLPHPTSAAGVALWLLPVVLIGALFALRHKLPARARTLARGMLQGTSVFLHPGRVLVIMAFATAAWLAEAFTLMVLCEAVGHPLTVSQGLWALVVLNLGVAIPISFASIGTFEAAITFALDRFHVPLADSLVIATIHHFVQAGSILLLGALVWLVTLLRTRRSPPEAGATAPDLVVASRSSAP